PDGLRHTIEGNIVQGVSRTLWEEVKFDANNVTSVDWMTYPILDIAEAPETIDVVLINHPEVLPSGAGEPSTRPVAAAIANAIFDGCVLAVPREASGVAMAATRALIRRGVKGLHLIALPTSSLQADLLIGAGCVETIETSAVSLGEFGPAPRFTAAVMSGAVRVKDATCPALHAAF